MAVPTIVAADAALSDASDDAFVYPDDSLIWQIPHPRAGRDRPLHEPAAFADSQLLLFVAMGVLVAGIALFFWWAARRSSGTGVRTEGRRVARGLFIPVAS